MSPLVRRCPVHYREEQRAITNSFRKNQVARPKWKWDSVVNMPGGESNVWCCKEQYCIGSWKVRSINQGKLEMVKPEMARLNTDILGISELKQTGISSVQKHSHIPLFATPWTVACQASLSITNSRSLLKLMSIASVMSSNHLILCCPLHLLPSIFARTRVFSHESVLRIRWLKYWSFSFSIGPSNEFRTDFL